MTTVRFDSSSPTGTAGHRRVLVALVDGGAGGGASGRVIGDTIAVRLDATGDGTAVLVRNDQISPTGTFYRATLAGASPSVVRTFRITSDDEVSWADESIQVVSPSPPSWVPVEGLTLDPAPLGSFSTDEATWRAMTAVAFEVLQPFYSTSVPFTDDDYEHIMDITWPAMQAFQTAYDLGVPDTQAKAHRWAAARFALDSAWAGIMRGDLKQLRHPYDHVIGATDEPVMENDWVDYGEAFGYSAARFRIIGEIVSIEMVIGGGDTSTTALTLPEGFRPPAKVPCKADYTSDGSTFTRSLIEVGATGAVVPKFPTPGDYCFARISFRIAPTY